MIDVVETYYILYEIDKNKFITEDEEIFQTLRFEEGDVFIIKTDVYDQLNEGHILRPISESHLKALNGLINLIEKRIDCINLSFGYFLGHVRREVFFQRIFNRAIRNKIIPVVAAGNSGPDFNTFQSLAKLNSIIVVGATNERMELQSFSSRGKRNSKYNLFVANGVLSEEYKLKMKAILGPSSKTFSEGTSFSTPIVSNIVCGIKKMYQLLEGLYHIAYNIKPLIHSLDFGAIGVPDDANYLPIEIYSSEMQENFKKGKYQFDVKYTNYEVFWIQSIVNFINKRNGEIKIVFSLQNLVALLKDMAFPLTKWDDEEVGHGFLSKSICFDYIAKFDPSFFLNHFSTLETDQVSKIDLDELDRKIGCLFILDRVKYVIDNCFYNQIGYPIKIN